MESDNPDVGCPFARDAIENTLHAPDVQHRAREQKINLNRSGKKKYLGLMIRVPKNRHAKAT
jgi:hypothetical protein